MVRRTALALAGMLALGVVAVPPGSAGAAARTRPGATASTGCSAPAPSQATGQAETLMVDGVPRTYLLFTPPPRRRPVPQPLVLDFHGLGEGDQIHALTTQMGQLGQRRGFVTAFPQGTGSPVAWDTSAAAAPSADLAFVSDLLATLEATNCIDTSRVYASGLSDGAFMVSLLACTSSTRFAALAAVSGLINPSPCHPARRVPLIVFHGTADPILYFNGGIGAGVLNHALSGGPAVSTTTVAPRLHGPGVPATVQAWAVRDGCAPRPRDTPIHPHVVLRTYRCPAGVAVAFYIILGGGHAWPGSQFSQKIAGITGPTTFEVDGTATIWRFFQRYRLPA